MARQNPISRVVELMRRMQKKVETDGKKEKDPFEKYECWYKTVVSKKESDTLMAQDRVSSLNGYIADIESGSIDFTSEAGDLEKELKNLRADINTMKENRDREHEEYSAAKDEMEKSVAALESAVDVLSTATEDMKGSALLVMTSDLKRAMNIGKTFVKKTDAHTLHKLLDGSTPEGDVFGNMAKDNKHMKKYKAKSGKIVEILADMLETFQGINGAAAPGELRSCRCRDDSVQPLLFAEDPQKVATSSLTTLSELLILTSCRSSVCILSQVGERHMFSQQ